MKKWKLEVEETKEGIQFTSRNAGFSALELIGVLSMKLNDIFRQRAGEIKPDISFRRTYVVDKKKKTTKRKK